MPPGAPGPPQPSEGNDMSDIPVLSRRGLLASALLAAGLPAAIAPAAADPRRPVRILVRSSWQTVNIGDIAHTPGILALLERHLPEAEVRLWPSRVDNGVDKILARRFPK